MKTKIRYNEDSKLVYVDHSRLGDELSSVQFMEMCMMLYNKVTYQNELTVTVHNPAFGDATLKFKDGEVYEL